MSSDQEIGLNELDTRSNIEREAAQWYALMQSDPVDAELFDAFEGWLSLSAVHREAYLEAELMADTLTAMVYLPEGQQVRDSLNEPDQSDTAEESSRDSTQGWTERLADWLIPARPAFAGVAVLAVVLSIALFWQPLSQDTQPGNIAVERLLSSGQGELKETQLEDGSTLVLGPLSQVQIRFDGARRLVELTAGEAFFDVAKDAARPFYVDAGSVSVKVVGTQFDVRKLPSTTSVGVVEGVVQVFPHAVDEIESADQEQVTMLVAGQQLNTDAAGEFQMDTAVSLNDVASWREGRLVYRGVPLQDILADANRYGLNPAIRLQDSQLGLERVTLSLNKAQVEDLPTMLAELLPVHVQRTEREILLQPRQ